MKAELTEVQQFIVKKLLTAFEEEELYVAPAIEKSTGRTVAVLIIFDKENRPDIPIPIGKLFTPHEDFPMDEYEFVQKEEESVGENIDGVNFTYGLPAEKSKPWWKKLFGRV